MNILGRPYTLFDPEQTAYIKRLERKEELKEKIVQGINQSIEAIDDYVDEFMSDDEVRNTISEAIASLTYISGLNEDDKLSAKWNETGNVLIEWQE